MGVGAPVADVARFAPDPKTADVIRMQGRVRKLCVEEQAGRGRDAVGGPCGVYIVSVTLVAEEIRGIR